MKKVLSVILVFALMLSIAGCGKTTETNETTKTETEKTETASVTETSDEAKASTDGVKITFLNTKGEIQAQLEEVAKVFQADTGIELEVVPTGAGTSPFEKMTALYASGNAPTLSMIDVGDLPVFAERMLDLSSEKWVADAMPGSLDIGKIDGEYLAFPFAVEGFALIYNKAVIEEATGSEFDPDSITTRAELESLFMDIEAGGTAPVIISPLDWSLAAHYYSIPFSVEGKTLDGMNGIIDQLKAGTLDIATSEAFVGTMDTFDMLLKYNKDKNDPLSGTYDVGASAVATGEAAFWFMGNWAWPQIDELSDSEAFGFLPVPIDVADNAGMISAGPSKYVTIDKDQSTPEQIEAAKTFLNWLIYEENGQNGLVKDCSIIPAFLNIEITPDDALAKSIIEYIGNDKVYPMVLTMPSDHWSEVGAHMQEYMGGFSTREELNEKIMTYWKNAK